MTDPFIKINTDPAEKIAALYGIGATLAERILQARAAGMVFNTPEDLASVKGISRELALALSPQIDWSVPQPEQKKRIEWGSALLFLAAIMMNAWLLLNRTLPSARWSFSHAQAGGHLAWVGLWIDLSVVFLLLGVVAFMLFFLLGSLSRDRARDARLTKYGILTFLLSSSIFGISLGLGNLIQYQYLVPEGWQVLLADPGAILGCASFLFIASFLLPGVLVYWKPRLAQSKLLARLFDISLLLGISIAAVGIWIYRKDWPLWTLALLGVGGFYLAQAGLEGIRARRSFFFAISEWVGIIKQSDPALQSTTGYKSWINAILPDVEKQKALKRALDEMYPPSRFQTFVNILVFGAGGWLVLTALGAIIQWFIENWLDKLFP